MLWQNNYYPFGLKHKGYNEIAGTGYKYKFGGKELNNELGLELYDFGARNYDAAIGRWLNMDPLAENSRRWTPYNYAYNNPVYFVDPDGMQSITYTGQAAQELFGMLKMQLDGPGDEFKTEEAAAEDFGKEYNGLSIRLDTEFRSNIYSYERDGTTYYTYDRPHGQYIRGEDGKNENSGMAVRFGGVDPKEDYVPKNGKKVADTHTHSAYEKASDDMFSMEQDISVYKGENVNGYVSVPGGLGLKYDVKTGSISVISNSLAYDKKHPTIKKNYNADRNPTVYPLIGVWGKKKCMGRKYDRRRNEN